MQDYRFYQDAARSVSDPLVGFLMRLYSRKLADDEAPTILYEESLSKIDGYDPARLGLRFLPLYYFRERLRQYLLATSKKVHRRYTFLEAVQMARSKQLPLQLSAESQLIEQSLREKEFLLQALRIEGNGNPLQSTLVNSPIDLGFEKWLKGVRLEMEVRVTKNKLLLFQNLARLDSTRMFELRASHPNVVREIHRADLLNLTVGKDGELYSPLILGRPVGLAEVATGGTDWSEWSESQVVPEAVLVKCILENPDDALRLLAGIQEVNRSVRDLDAINALISERNLIRQPLEMQRKLAELRTAMELPALTPIEAQWLRVALADRVTWTSRYRLWKKFSIVLPLLNLLLDGKAGLRDLAVAMKSKTGGLVRSAFKTLVTEMALAIGYKKNKLADVSIDRSPEPSLVTQYTLTIVAAALVAVPAAIAIQYLIVSFPEQSKPIVNYIGRTLDSTLDAGAKLRYSLPAPPTVSARTVAAGLAVSIAVPALCYALTRIYALVKSGKLPVSVGKSSTSQIFQYDARGTPLPYFLETPNVRDLNDYTVQKAYIAPGLGEPGLPRLRSTVAIAPYQGKLLPLSKSMGQAIHGISIKNSAGTELTAKIDYDILCIPSRDAFYVRFKEPQATVVYELALSPYLKGADYPTDGATVLATETAIQDLVAIWRDLGFGLLASDLEEHLKNHPQLTVGHLSELLKKRNTYPLEGRILLESLSEDSVWAYQPFARKGCLNGNCGVGNGFGTASSNTLLVGAESPIRAEVRVCYVVEQDGIIREGRHVRSFFYSGDQLLEVADFTPEGLLPEGVDQTELDQAFDQAMSRMSHYAPSVEAQTEDELVLGWAEGRSESLSRLGFEVDILRRISSQQSQVDPDQLLNQTFSAAKALIRLIESPELEAGVQAYFAKVEKAVRHLESRAVLLSELSTQAFRKRAVRSQREAQAALKAHAASAENGISLTTLGIVDDIQGSMERCAWELSRRR
jgi:hypothetical protein